MPLLPNLIISGAPKCGSTSFFYYLADHPQICSANVQETRYLIDEDYPIFPSEYNYAKFGLEGYDRFFADYDPSIHKILLECTPDYLYQDTAFNVIRAMPSNPNILFLLRKPSRRIYSLYKYAQNNIGALEGDLSFREFVMAVRQEKIPAEQKILANALGDSYYAKHIERWIQELGQERVVVVLFEDLVNQPAMTMADLARRIGIDDHFYDSYVFGQRNKTIQVKNRSLYKAVRSIKKEVPGIEKLKPITAPLKKWYDRKVVSRVSNEVSLEEKEVMAELDQEFRGGNAELSRLASIDTGVWN